MTDRNREVAGNTAVFGVVILLILAGMSVVAYIFFLPNIDFGKSRQTVPELAPTQVLTSTDLQKFQMDISPFLTTQESMQLRSEVSVRNLALLLSDGRVQYSHKSFAFKQGEPWMESSPPEITGVRLVLPTGFEVEDARHNRFDFNLTQPFVIEGHLGNVYTVDKDGKVYSAAIDQLQLVDETSVPDPTLGPNSLLSLSY